MTQQSHSVPAAAVPLSEQQFNAVFEFAGVGMALLDTGSRVLKVNRALCQMLGRTEAELAGARDTDLVGAEDIARDREMRGLLLDGLFPSYQAEKRYRHADGSTVLAHQVCTLVRDAQGRPVHFIVQAQDLSARAAAEAALRASQARAAELQAANEELRASISSLAHDLRAPLAAIDGFSLELARRAEDGLDEVSRHYLRRVRAGVRAIGELTEAMLALMRLSQAPLLRETVDLSAIAAGWLQRMRGAEPERRVAVDIAPTPPARGDARLLAMLLEQLLDNAWKFTGKREHAHIAFGALPGPSGAAAVYFVRDDGAGFDPAYADKLFMPFQRLHGAGEFPGAGVGLAMARKIAARHGGRVWAESREGQGASFHFTLGEAADATMGA